LAKKKELDMRKMSEITEGLIGQPMFKLSAKVKKMEELGQKIFHFEIGDSDFRAHQHVIDATKKALDDDKTHYVNSTGISELKEAICEHTEKFLGFKPANGQIVVMPSNAIIDFVVRVLAGKGDEIICPDPGFSTYIAVTNYTGVKKVGVPLKEENNFSIKIEEIEKRITAKTRLIICNSPNNPTGAVMSKEDIENLAFLAKKHDIYLLSDEIYSRVIYSGEHYSPSFIDRCLERTIILDGFAKGYSMPGWRLGYAIGPKDVMEKVGLLFQTIYSCTPPFIQYGGIEALRGNQSFIVERIKQYGLLRDLIVEKLNEIPGVSCQSPNGACYVFPNIKGTGMTSSQFADFALNEADVALLPGTCFGENGEGYVRLCFTRKPEIIEAGCQKLKEAVEKKSECESVTHKV